MARKKKETKQSEAQPAQEAQNSSAGESSPVSQVAAKPEKKQEPGDNMQFTLEDACRRLVVGYKAHWLPSISRFAKTHGLPGKATLAEFRSLLGAWGAKLN